MMSCVVRICRQGFHRRFHVRKNMSEIFFFLLVMAREQYSFAGIPLVYIIQEFLNGLKIGNKKMRIMKNVNYKNELTNLEF